MSLQAVVIAQVCHEANRAYCTATGDPSQASWEDAPQWQKDSAMQGVVSLINDPSLTPQQMHKLWWTQKINDGWTLGPVKDATLKTHPCMKPFEELPKTQQRKDYLFHAIVKALGNLPPGYVTT